MIDPRCGAAATPHPNQMILGIGERAASASEVSSILTGRGGIIVGPARIGPMTTGGT